MKREDAWKLLNEMMSNKNLIRHGLAVEYIMRDLCNYLKERVQDSGQAGMTVNKHTVGDIETEFNEEEWAVVGLLHDADYELIEKDVTKHTLVTAEKLEALGVSERIIQAIKAHHYGIKPTRDNILESGVYAVDEMSGLITACALVQPEKKLATVELNSVLKKFKQPSFAAGARRDQITEGIAELNMSLEDFTKLALESMQKHSEALGL
jgi:predicted hydrolase (HD superfamily)